MYESSSLSAAALPCGPIASLRSPFVPLIVAPALTTPLLATADSSLPSEMPVINTSVDAGPSKEQDGVPMTPLSLDEKQSLDGRKAETMPKSSSESTAYVKPKTKRKSPWIAAVSKQPRDPYPSIDEAPPMTLQNASWLSKLTFHWVQPLLVVGYFRTLEKEDLGAVLPEMQSGFLADKFLASFDRRLAKDKAWNRAIEDGTYKPSSMRRTWWKIRSSIGLGKSDGTRTLGGLAGPISDVFGWYYWSAGFCELTSAMAVVTSPLVTRRIIVFATRHYDASRGIPTDPPESIGYGVGLAIIVALLQLIASFGTNHFFMRAGAVGALSRGMLIAALARRSTVLSGKARTVISNGRLIVHVGTDVTRIDTAALLFPFTWTACIEFIVIVVILVVQLGASALAGIAFLFLTMLPQGYAMKKLFESRQKIMVWTDKRTKLIQELLSGMRIIKMFHWEDSYLLKVGGFRDREMSNMRGLLVYKALSFALFVSGPMIASVLAFSVRSAVTGQRQNVASTWTSFTLFSLAAIPFALLPMALAALTDGHNASQRISEVFLAETRTDSINVDEKTTNAIEMDADFQWEGLPPSEDAEDDDSKKKEKELEKAAKKNKKKSAENKKGGNTLEEKVMASDNSTPVVELEPMQLKGMKFDIPKGQLCAIVGPVGCGKSSLLQAIVSEMKCTRGSTVLGGTIAYASQVPWIRSESVRDNITFGHVFDQERYDRAVEASCLAADLELMPFGDATEIGERGLSLSGGQRARLSLARALYYDADIVLLDDVLSALDAKVGRQVFDKAILGELRGRGKTCVLVTHALYYLPRVDRIITLREGRIQQDGEYAQLIADGEDGRFAKLISEFGGRATEQDLDEMTLGEDNGEIEDSSKIEKVQVKADVLMQEEDREEGAVSGKVYWRYLKAAQGYWTLPLAFFALALMESAEGLAAWWLTWWQQDRFGASGSFYAGIYALLGVLSAFFSFGFGFTAAWVCYNASRRLHHDAIRRVMFSKISWIDTTPLGRITNRFSKDVDAMDNELMDEGRAAAESIAKIGVAVVLTCVVQPWFALIFACVTVIYACVAGFYRASAREIQRLDNLLRSAIYADFSETLSGLATIRAFGQTNSTLRRIERLIDIENRALYLTVVNQRWLSLRLDALGVALVFAVALLAVGGRNSISPSQIGLILAYILSIQGSATWLIHQIAEFENKMTSVERIVHYANEVEQEKPAEIEATQPSSAWPLSGSITFQDVKMRYRDELPLVLKGLSFRIEGGQKIGIIGRTGAGKSSILQALYRLVEIDSGMISIDDVDISTIGLRSLREKMAILPQDFMLFTGTLRSNLDPFGQYEDAVLWDALRRAHLIDREVEAAPINADKDLSESPIEGSWNRFTLDMVLEAEGTCSVGEKSLISLARALVRDSKIMVLDEPSSALDYGLDAQIQQTIRTEFKDKTLLVIAHRLATIIDMDKILVMDDGVVSEFDTPSNLYQKTNGIFRSLCDQSNISEAEINRQRSF